MSLQRLVITFKPEEIIIHVLHRTRLGKPEATMPPKPCPVCEHAERRVIDRDVA